MRWRTILQGIEQKAKFVLRFFRRDFQGIKHFLLHIGAVNTHRAAAHLPAVEHHVITLRDALLGGCYHPVFMPFLGCRERVMHCGVALRLLIKLKHRKINHPHRAPGLLEQSVLLAKLAVANLDAQSTDGVVDNLGFVSAKENQVSILRTGAGQHFGNGFVVNVLDDGRLQARPPKGLVARAFGQLVDLDVRQPFGPIDFDKLSVSINLATAQAADFTRATRNAQTHHTAALHGRGTREHLEVHVGHHVSQLGEFELDAQVGLVRAITMHGLRIRHHREFAQVNIQGGLENGRDHFLEHVTNILFTQKRGLNINLCEFGLTVSAQVFITKALGDLVITIETRHHQQLLEQLRALRQGKKVALMNSTGYQIVARALGGGLAQHRGFNVNKTVGIEKLAHLHGHAVAQHQIVLHIGAAQIQHPVRQARGLAQVVIIELERGRDRRVEYRQLMAKHLDLAALEAFIDRAFRAGAHQAFDLNTKLVAQTLGHLEHVGTVWVAHHLHVTFAVPNIDKNHAPVVAPTINPTAQGDGLTQQGVGYKTAIVRAHGHKQLSEPASQGGTGYQKIKVKLAWAQAQSRPLVPLNPWKSHRSVPHPHSCAIQSLRSAAAAGKTRWSGSVSSEHRHSQNQPQGG